MLFLQILAIIASAVFGIWMVGVFLVGAFHPKTVQVGVLNLVLGVPSLALAVWLPFAFGWIVV